MVPWLCTEFLQFFLSKQFQWLQPSLQISLAILPMKSLNSHSSWLVCLHSTAWYDSERGKDTAHSGTYCVLQYTMWLWRSKIMETPQTFIWSTCSRPESRGLQVVYTTLEVGAVGHYRPQAVKTLRIMVPDMPLGAAIYAQGNGKSCHFLLLACIQCKKLYCMAQWQTLPQLVHLFSFFLFFFPFTLIFMFM